MHVPIRHTANSFCSKADGRLDTTMKNDNEAIGPNDGHFLYALHSLLNDPYLFQDK